MTLSGNLAKKSLPQYKPEKVLSSKLRMGLLNTILRLGLTIKAQSRISSLHLYTLYTQLHLRSSLNTQDRDLAPNFKETFDWFPRIFK